ncbi:hypothetical protein J6590_048317 [Homalodisca vitripennis]|nr:hypothetical protein J6590_048317 [Homalodisca vitripennis]
MAYLENFHRNSETDTTIKSGKPYDAVDTEVLQKARTLQETLMPLQADVISSLARSSASIYLPINTDPGLCRSHSQHTLHSVLNSEMWALRMLDAASKVPSGLLDGFIQDLGNFDQCIRVEETKQKFKGQYCVVKARALLSDSMESYFRNTVLYDYSGGSVTFSLCVPSTCDSQDIIVHLDRSIKDAGLNVSTDKFIVFCSTNEPRPFKAEDWFTVATFSTIIALVILSTWYESKTSEKKSELLHSFSMISNWQKLKDTTVSSSDVSCLNGLRIILTFFVVIIHRYFYYQVLNFTSYLEMKNDPWMRYLLWSLTLSAEILIMISGIIRAYIFLQNHRRKKFTNIFKQYIKHYFRVTPSMAVIVLFLSTLQIHLSEGPFWDRYIGTSKFVCSNLWWANLLHISSCYGTPILCQVETWLLAVDFQLFMLSPLLLLPLLHHPKLGVVLLAVVYVLSSVFRTADTSFNQIHPDISLDK